MFDIFSAVPPEQMPLRVFTCETCLDPLAIVFTAYHEYDVPLRWLQLIAHARSLPFLLVLPSGESTAFVLDVDPETFQPKSYGSKVPEYDALQFAALLAEIRQAHHCPRGNDQAQ